MTLPFALVHNGAGFRWLSGMLACCLVVTAILSTGCAAIISGSNKDVTFFTYPEGGTVYYEGRPIADGEQVRVRKSLASSNKVNVGTRDRPVLTDFQREVDPWFIGSCALVLLFVIPGVVAISVDLITGAAMDPLPTQNFTVRE